MRIHLLPWLLAIAPALVLGQSPQSVRDCPLPCDFVNGTSWLPYSHVSDLDRCNQTVLFQVMLYQPLNDPDIGSIVQACAASSSSLQDVPNLSTTGLTNGLTNDTALFKRKSFNASAINSVTTFAAGVTCMDHVETPTKAQRELQLLWSSLPSGEHKGGQSVADDINASAEHLAEFVSKDLSCTASIMFAKTNNVTMGVYVGSQVSKAPVAALVREHMSPQTLSGIQATPGQVALQVCGEEQLSSQQLGVFADLTGDALVVQTALREWHRGYCVNGTSYTQRSLGRVELGMLPGLLHGGDVSAGSNSGVNSTATKTSNDTTAFSLHKRNNCQVRKVVPGQGCQQTAKACGISQDDFIRFNGGDPNICTTLQANQRICCSSGSLPDTAMPAKADGTCAYVQQQGSEFCSQLATKCGGDVTVDDLTVNNGGDPKFCDKLQKGQYVCCGHGKMPNLAPKKNADGSCFVYETQPGDNCAALAAAHAIPDIKLLDTYNKNTWGWLPCPALQKNMRICLSDGDPPLPMPVQTAACGPLKPGTQRPTDGTSLADVNPCPLNVCCNVWGNCGIDNDFCVPAPIPGGGPGAAKPGSNGCISRCGMNITNNASPPRQFRTIAYFEAWNVDARACLNMDISRIADSAVAPPGGGTYSTVHFAFGNITNDFTVDVSGAQGQFDGLKKLQGIRRVISFGGWGFSNAPSTYGVFRRVVHSQGSRGVAAKNIVQFVVDNELDGVDFDWEYPGATDIPGTPAGDPVTEGSNYLEFLKTVRSLLPADKTLSIAAPASYWYLQHFPIKDMAKVVDYIIYMTYDLHGQWDYGNQYSTCLRSHVNLTETMTALGLITKAGVSADKVIVGMARYGRSFAMSQAGCTGPMCTFTGDRLNSNAAPGPCTNTAGYISNFEINQILMSAVDPDTYGTRRIQQFQDEGDVLVYDDTQWVSYLTDDSYSSRASKWRGLNFGGMSDWAVDLVADFGSGGNGKTGDDGTGSDSDDTSDGYGTLLCDVTKSYATFDDLAKDAGGMSSYCANYYSLDVLSSMLDDAYSRYNDANNGYDTEFGDYVRYMKNIVPAVIDDFLAKKGDGLKYFDCALTDDLTLKTQKSSCDQMKDSLHEGFVKVTLVLRDADGFAAELLKDYGIPADWLDFNGTYEETEVCYSESTTSCPLTAGKRSWYGYPEVKADVTIPNPKDIVTHTIGNVDDLETLLFTQRLDILLGTYNGLAGDVVQVMSVPVFLLVQAVDGMEQVKVLASKQEEEDREKRKNFILEIVGALLFVVPFIGEEAAMAAGLTSLARAVTIIGEVGNAAMGVYSVVDDPSSALFAVMGMLFGVRGIAKSGRDGKGFRDMADKRAGWADSDIAKLGKAFKDRNDKLQSIVKVCRR